jgi:flagellar biosynthesis protein FlhB
MSHDIRVTCGSTTGDTQVAFSREIHDTHVALTIKILTTLTRWHAVTAADISRLLSRCSFTHEARLSRSHKMFGDFDMNCFLPLVPLMLILAYAIYVAYKLEKIRERKRKDSSEEKPL